MVSVSGVFDADRVAVVGATDREGSVGRAITRNLLEDFTGEVVPVNPNIDCVFDHPCRDDLSETAVDLAVVVVPPDVALDVVETAGKEGIENVVVITAGFGEAGGEGA
ncbi:MAG: CoA-binding protein, partial [Natronomonas sp.]